MVRRLNIDGDGQGDLAGHGGEYRAVFVYQMDACLLTLADQLDNRNQACLRCFLVLDENRKNGSHSGIECIPLLAL